MYYNAHHGRNCALRGRGVAALWRTALPAPGGFRKAAGDGRSGLGGRSTGSTTTTAAVETV